MIPRVKKLTRKNLLFLPPPALSRKKFLAFFATPGIGLSRNIQVLLNYASVFAWRVAQNRARRCHRSEMARYDYALAFRQQRILSYRV